MLNRVPAERVLIWDKEAVPKTSAAATLMLWRAFVTDNTKDCVSIPELVEEKSLVLRSRFLAWVHEFGEMCIGGYRIVDHMELRIGFSYWWMNRIAEKCNFSKSPQITDAIKLIALTDWALDKEIKKITLVSANCALAECLSNWCLRSGIKFTWQRESGSPLQKSRLRKIYMSLSPTFRACVWILRYLISHWQLRSVGLKQWKDTEGKITFVSYLTHHQTESIKYTQFESQYWGPLPSMLRREQEKTNWLHLYVKNKFLPNAKIAAATIQNLNKSGDGNEIHTTLDAFLSIGVVFRAFTDWFRLSLKARKLGYCIEKSIKSNDLIWPLFREDWKESTSGNTALSNALYAALFYSATRALPKQKICCYLQENQAWEFALIQNWQLADQGFLVGVPHTSVRFWDLRYYFDPRSYCIDGRSLMPLPDKVAVNGEAAASSYLEGGYPTDKLMILEALRYSYLDESRIRQEFTLSSGKYRSFRILVFGDYIESNTRLQMNLLIQAYPSIAFPVQIIVKAHPMSPIRTEDYPELPLTIATAPISELLSQCEVVYTSAVTSAALDAYCSGLPLITVMNPNTLNMSPLRGYRNVFFVNSPNELIVSLKSALAKKRAERNSDTIFTLDRGLPRWRKLLGCL